MTYLLHLLIAIDQLANALLGGAPDETLSARAFRSEADGKVFGRFFRPVIDTVFFFDPEHCRKAWVAEIQKLQLHRSYRD